MRPSPSSAPGVYAPAHHNPTLPGRLRLFVCISKRRRIIHYAGAVTFPAFQPPGVRGMQVLHHHAPGCHCFTRDRGSRSALMGPAQKQHSVPASTEARPDPHQGQVHEEASRRVPYRRRRREPTAIRQRAQGNMRRQSRWPPRPGPQGLSLCPSP